MSVVQWQRNIKVCFAASEQSHQRSALEVVGIGYTLYTVFPWLERVVLNGGNAEVRGHSPPSFDSFRVIVQDSGLFTLMFGAFKGKKDAALMDRWYDALVQFTLARDPRTLVVEVDCQKVLGVDKAWEYRERMRRDLPNHRQINVFHLEDGQAGLDRLVEWTDYLALSVPELRFSGRKDYVERLRTTPRGGGQTWISTCWGAPRWV